MSTCSHSLVFGVRVLAAEEVSMKHVTTKPSNLGPWFNPGNIKEELRHTEWTDRALITGPGADL